MTLTTGSRSITSFFKRRTDTEECTSVPKDSKKLKNSHSSSIDKAQTSVKSTSDKALLYTESSTDKAIIESDSDEGNAGSPLVVCSDGESVVNVQTEDQYAQLSDEQKFVLNEVVTNGKNAFITGSAGVGKSFLLRSIIRQLKGKHGEEKVAVTSSTGVAALLIDGQTLHSFAGVGLGNGSKEHLAKMMEKKNIHAASRWKNTRVIVIDEISMVDADFFDKLEHIAKQTRRSSLPFGGIQVVCVGDFFQLPPVSKDKHFPARYCFEAESWQRVIQNKFVLTKIFRQKDDVFVRVLNEMRTNSLSEDSIRLLKSLNRPLELPDGIQPAELFSLRWQVDKVNTARINALPGESRLFEASDSLANPNDEFTKKRLDQVIAPVKLELKLDAQVMLVTNLEQNQGLVNGSMGKVIGFTEPEAQQESYPIVCFPPTANRQLEIVRIIRRHEWTFEDARGRQVGCRKQIPLIPSYAISIHKSQGQTIDWLKIDLGKAFEYGQSYVAVSRATTLDGIQILNFDLNKVKANPKVVQFYANLPSLEVLMKGEVTYL
ncbi:hypothetical protein MIR68_002516 [Amoeboaphelidium protococcarum]|nr:hypothetical protein MIR68_002516 [Amoeboaphelidium protococcarum]